METIKSITKKIKHTKATQQLTLSLIGVADSGVFFPR